MRLTTNLTRARFVPMLIFTASLCLAGLTLPAAAQELTEQHVDNLYQRHMAEIAPYYQPYDGDYVAFPTYDPRKKNSSGIDEREWIAANTREGVYYDKQNRKHTRPITKIREELEAVTKIIPDFTPGSYGYIDSGEVVEVADNVLVLKDIWLVDARALRDSYRDMKTRIRRDALRDIADERDRGRRRDIGPIANTRLDQLDELDWQFEEREHLQDRQRDLSNMQLIIEGVNTRNIKQGRRWPADPRQNIPIAIVREVANRVYAIPATELRKRLTDQQFQDLLQKRGYDKALFAELVLEVRRDFPRDYVPIIIEALESDYNPEVARRGQQANREAMLKDEETFDKQWQSVTDIDNLLQ